MAENLTPGEKRAEEHRQNILSLKSAATTEEMLEAADSVKEVAGRVIKNDEKFLVKVKGEINKANDQPE